MTQKAWNLAYRKADPDEGACGTCACRQAVPADWCDEVGMAVKSDMTCCNHMPRKESKWSK